MTVSVKLVQERLRLISSFLEDLDLVGDVDEARLQSDRIVRHAVERILTQLVDLAVSVNGHISAAVSGNAPGTYRESYHAHAAAKAGAITPQLAAELAPSAGLRNILTHEYVAVDLSILAGAVPMARRLYKEYVRQVAAFLRESHG